MKPSMESRLLKKAFGQYALFFAMLLPLSLLAQDPVPTPISPENIRIITNGGDPSLLPGGKVNPGVNITDPKGVGENPSTTPESGTEVGADLLDDEDEKEIIVKKRQALPPAKIYGQQFFRDKSISLFTASRKIEAFNSYILDAGDKVSITIWGDAYYSGTFQITDEGYCDLSQELVYVPRLYLKGVAFGKAKDIIRNHLGRYINLYGPKTQIEITLNYSRNITVNITGEVFTPGSYTIPATNTAFNALVASGGPSQIGSVREIKIISNNKEPRTLDVYQYILDPSAKEEFFLSNNDFVYVPLADRVVKISGAIKRPFYYELIKKENLIDLIRFAGDLQPDAYTANVQVKRFLNNEEILIDVNLDQLKKSNKDFELLDGDEVTISYITQSYSNFVTVEGAVKLPGEYELSGDSTYVYDILAKAGLLGSARTDRIYIIRYKDDLSKDYLRINLDSVIANKNSVENIKLQPFDLVRIKPKSDFRNDYEIRIYGAVREPGGHVFSRNLSLKDVIFLSGGLREEAANNRIEISRIVKGYSEDSRVIVNTIAVDDNLNFENDIFLEPFDNIYVRTAPDFQLQQHVILSGEVRFPGVYPIVERNEKISSLIQRAGGLTESAFPEGAKMNRKEDKTGIVLLDAKQVIQDPNSNYNYILKAGDSIHIPKLKDLVALKGLINFPAIDSGKIKMISVPYHEGKNAKFYVYNYGAGINKIKFGKNINIYVTYPNGEVRKTRRVLWLFKKYPHVDKGSVVSVEPKQERPKKERPGGGGMKFSELYTMFIQQVTTALTLYLLVRRATD